MQRRIVAFLFHAPGLWLFYRERLSGRHAVANAVALLITITAIALVWPRGSLFALIAWLVGHALWGACLAATLPLVRQSQEESRSGRM